MENTTYEPISEMEDLNLPATKGDLKALVTRTYLKAELEKFATKADLEVFRQEMNERLAELPTREDFNRLYNAVDQFIGEVRTNNQERAVESHRLERIEKWIKEAARATGVPFET